MATHFRHRRYMRNTVYATGALGLLVLVGVNLFGGDTGLLAKWRLEAQISDLERELASVEAERAYWERRVASLDPDNVDLDMLAEQARRVLFFTAPDEVVIDAASLSPEP